MFDVRVEHDVLDSLDLVVRVVNHFKVGRWGKVKHLFDSVVASIQFD